MVMPVLGLGVREGERQRVLGTMEGVEGQRQGARDGSSGTGGEGGWRRGTAGP